MTTTIWRYAHLALAVVSFIFLLIASITGVILGIDAVQERSLPYKVDNFHELTLSQVIPNLKDQYAEIFEISVDHNQFVTLEGFDEDGNDVKSIINPNTGELIASPIVKSDFYQWNLALHRSLFLKETGRFVVGVISFLLMLITISGTILIIRRQQGIKKFFSKIHKDSFSQYFHVFSSRILLIPVFIIALTGTYLFLLRFEMLSKPEMITKEITSLDSIDESNTQDIRDFSIFNEIKLSKVQKVEFPFADDPEEFYKIKTKEKELTIHQFSGDIISETQYDTSQTFERWSIDLHTGRTNIIWAIFLSIASLNIVFFIISGFKMTYNRLKNRIPKNKYTAQEAEYIILVGSENGTTKGFARNIHQQFINNGKKSFVTELNQYCTYPSAKHLLVFTSTYGEGEAPFQARNFLDLLTKIPQRTGVEYSVVGFGSKSYEQFCEFAYAVDRSLKKQSWAVENLPVFTVNDKSPEEFIYWVKAWSGKNKIPLATATSLYEQEIPNLCNLEVIEAPNLPEGEDTFQVILKPKKNAKFQSGDLLAIYPEKNHKERFYSISKQNGHILLVVKLHELGLGSNFLFKLKKGDKIPARIIQNDHFHFPAHAKQLTFIANGTGIAPFLGMIENNISKVPIGLYCGFRFKNKTTEQYIDFANRQKQLNHLSQFNIAFSRAEESQYVMDLIHQDEAYFSDTLENGGIIMICGSLAMLRDVEQVLNDICLEHLGTSLCKFKANGQLLTDCY